MEDPRLFFKNMLKSTFKTKVSNTDEFTSPVVDAIRENTEAVKDKDVAKQMSKPIVTALVDVMDKIDERKEYEDSKLDKLFSNIQQLKIDKILDEIESVKGEKGDDGHTPTEEELIPIIEPLIKPLIPDPIPGEPGKDYVLTAKDKKEIAKSIKVPVVEKVIETIIEKQPIVTNEVKEVAVADTPEKIKEKLEGLEGEERLDAKAIKNLPKSIFGGGGGIKRIDAANDTRIISPTNGQTLVWNSTRQVWENSSASAGSGTVETIVAGNNIDVDATDPANPIVSVETLTLADISDVTATATEVNYTDGVTSAIQTQLDGKSDEFVTYIVDAAGGGDYTDIQSAVTALGSSKGKILVKGGTYTLSAAITVAADGVNIIGEGDATNIVFDGSTITNAFQNSGTTKRTGLRFSDFRITSSSVGNGVGIRLDHWKNSVFQNIHIVDTNGGFYGSANQVFYNAIYNCLIEPEGTANYGFKFDLSANDNALYNCRVMPDAGALTTGFLIDAGGITLDGCTCESGAIGVDIQSSANSIRVIGGWFESNTVGIKIASGVESVTLLTKCSGNTTNISDLGCKGLFAQIEGDSTDPQFYFTDSKFSLTPAGLMGLNLGASTPPDTVDFQAYSSSVPSSIDLSHTIAVASSSANATNKYLGQFGWLSRDTSFSAPKLVAYIGAEATETYGADVDTGSDMAFYVGAVNGTNPTEKLRLTSASLVPGASDGTALGTTALQFSDLFLASGGVINWAASDFTLTHSTGALAFSGGIVVNNGATAVDFQVKGDTDTHLLFVDTGDNWVGVNQSTWDSWAKLYVNGGARFSDDFRFQKGSGEQVIARLNSSASGATGFDLKFEAGNRDMLMLRGSGALQFGNADLTEIVFNENGNDYPMRFEGDTDANLLYLDAINDRIGIGTASPGVKLDLGTTNAVGCGSIELGHATDTTLSRSAAGVLAVEGVVIPSISSTNTLTNKRNTRRLTTTNAPGATPTTNTDNVDVMNFTGLATAITSMTTNLSGTPVDGDLIEFRFTDDGTARGITWGASFAATTVALPTTTVINTMLRVGFEYSGSTWKCIATC